MSNILVTKYPFTMPEVGGTELIVIKTPTCVNLIDGCWLWNPSVGYLEVDASNGTDNIIVTNPGRLENAKPGTQFPSCMEFFVDAPTALPTYDPTVTCLAADFMSPEVGETGIMVVDDTSHIRETDIIIIDRQYRYTVVEVLDEHRLLVRNEGDGKEGIIDVKCDECLSVKVLYSTFCCKVVREELQAEIDAINDRLNNKKSIKPWSGNNLVTISGGDNALTDAQFDCTIKVEIPKGDLTVTSTDNVLTINSGSGTEALLKNANINLDLSAFAKKSEIPVVNNGVLTINIPGQSSVTFTANQAGNSTVNIPAVNNGALTVQDSGGNILGTFTANQSGNTTVTIPSIPPIPTVPSVYSNSITDYQSHSGLNIKLESDKNDGTPSDDVNKPIPGGYSTVSISSSGVSGSSVTVFGNISVTVEGEYNSDTHTYRFGDEAGNSSNHLVFVTARGPSIQVTAEPKINGNTLYSQPMSSGYTYYCGLDYVNAPNGSSTGPSRKFSIHLSIPIAYEATANSTYNLTLDLKIWGSNLRKQHGGSGATLVNEPIDLTVNKVTSYTALGWVIK